MSLFVCDECGCVENTALAGPLGGYWGRNAEGRDGKARCSLCNPESKYHGEWHGKFPRKQWDGKREVINRP